MNQKIIKVGNSAAVTLPKSFLRDAGWAPGQEVMITTDTDTQTISIQPHKKKLLDKKAGITPEFVQSVDEFIQTYKPALEELAKR